MRMRLRLYNLLVTGGAVPWKATPPAATSAVGGLVDPFAASDGGDANVDNASWKKSRLVTVPYHFVM